MNDQGKTKAQLIDELTKLRRQVAKLKTAQAEHKQAEKELKLHQNQLEKLVETRAAELKQENIERKQAEQTLQRNKREWESVFNAMSDWVCLIDLDAQILYTNRAGEEFVGIPAADIIDQRCCMLLHETGEQIPGCPLSKMLHSRQRESVEFQTIDGDRWLMVVVDPVMDQAKNLVGAVHIIRDITERKRAEESLRESEERFRTLSASAPIGIFLTDNRGWTVYVNPRWQAISGLTLEESVGHGWNQVIHPDDRFATVKAWTKAVYEGHEFSYECRLITPRQDMRWVHVRAERVVSATGKLTGYVGSVEDITERKQAEEALKEDSEQLKKMVKERTLELQQAQEKLVHQEKLAVMGQLAGGVAHELRNPLANIKNAAYFLNLILTETEPEVNESLNILDKEVAVADRIIGSLLDFARTKTPLQQNAQINKVLEEALSRIAVPDVPHIEIVYQPDQSLPIILTDPDQLGQVFDNLIRNAIQAMPEGGQLNIKSERQNPKRVAISITDTGGGIPEESIGKIFEPLFTTRAKGIGLGLALVKILVEANKGSIEVESEIGQGSKFTVKLPLIE